MLGIEKNQKSGITLNNKFQTQIPTEDLLTPDRFRHFYILLHEGSILVGIVGEKPFMRHERQTRFDLRYLGFCSDYNSTAIWDFCVFGKDLALGVCALFVCLFVFLLLFVCLFVFVCFCFVFLF